MKENNNPEKVIQQQVEAYNQRNIEDFVACHHPEVELYNFSESEPFLKGRVALRERYGAVFNSSPLLNTEIINRMVMGQTVIDHEIVTGRKGVEQMEIVAVYEVEDNLITKAHFIWKH